jgi:alpha-amylase/alpha-mannosidase (GH57 family)
MNHKTRLAILWHMHQPFYRNAGSGAFDLPWLRLHAIKDYFGMVHLLEDFPGLRLTFNLVPSLLAGLDFYRAGTTDPFQDVFRKEAAQLGPAECDFLVRHFFAIQHDNHIRPFRRFEALYQKKMSRLAQDGAPDWRRVFSAAELRDLQVWFQLSQVDEFYKDNDARIRALLARGQGFSEDDKAVLDAVEAEILERIVPEYKRRQDSGQIELCTSPFYHPIMPLLLDPQQGRKANPGLPEYELEFDWEDDLRAQLQSGLDLMEKTFGRRPSGIWPPEGSLCERTLEVLDSLGVAWTASDERVLGRSLPQPLERDSRFEIASPETLYRPYRLGGRAPVIFFRDQILSDLIGFYYQKFPAGEAAADLYRRIKDIARSSPQSLTIPIILDGENAWEFYPGSGRAFLREFYGLLAADDEIETVTFSRAAEGPAADLAKLRAGSWINANFDIWIGDREDQRGWEFLKLAKDAIMEARGDLRPEQAAEVEELLHIAQGSDWFWWYGRENYTPDIAIFDNLFRQNLIRIFQVLGRPVPEALTLPIAGAAHARQLDIAPPRDHLEVRIDGRISDFFEWRDAGRIDIHSYGGAMNIANPIVKTLYFGFTPEQFLLRIDTKKDALTYFENGFSLRVSVRCRENSWLGEFAKKATETVLQNTTGGAQGAVGRIIELQVPAAFLGAGAGSVIALQLEWSFQSRPFQAIPASGALELKVPEARDYAAYWQV